MDRDSSNVEGGDSILDSALIEDGQLFDYNVAGDIFPPVLSCSVHKTNLTLVLAGSAATLAPSSCWPGPLCPRERFGGKGTLKERG